MMDTPEYVEYYSSRDDWGGGPVRSGHAAPPEQFVGWVEHHTVFAMRDYDRDGFLRGDVDDVRRYMQTLQVARPDLGNEVPYSWVIFPGSNDQTCIIAEGRGRGRTGAHTAGLNSTRYAWAIAGNTDEDLPVTPGMIIGMRWLASVMLTDPVNAVPAIGHQQAPPYYQNGANLNATGCPGSQGMSVLPQLQPPYTTPQEGDDIMDARQEAIMLDIQAWVKGATQEKLDRTIHAIGADRDGVPGLIDIAIDTNIWVKARVVDSDGSVDLDRLEALVRELPGNVADALAQRLTS